MPTTDLPEIGAKNRYQKTNTINRRKNGALFYSLPKTGTKKVWNKTACQTHRKSVTVGDFYRRDNPTNSVMALKDDG